MTWKVKHKIMLIVIPGQKEYLMEEGIQDFIYSVLNLLLKILKVHMLEWEKMRIILRIHL